MASGDAAMYLPLAGESVSSSSAAGRGHARSLARLLSCIGGLLGLSCVVILSAARPMQSPPGHAEAAQKAVFLAADGGSFLGGIFTCLVVIVILAVIAYVGGTWLISTSLKNFMTKYDRDVLGVEVTMDHMEMKVTRGKFHAQGLKMTNPAGFNQKSSLIDSEEVFVDIDMIPYVKSRGNVLEVEHLSLRNTTIFFEKPPSKDSLSNIETVLKNLRETREYFDPRDPNRKRTKQRIILHKVDLVGVKVQVKTDYCGKAIKPPLVHLKDMHYADFEKDKGDSLADDIGVFLLGSLLKSAMTGTKSFFESSKVAFQSGIETAKEKIDAAKEKAIEANPKMAAKAQEMAAKAKEMKEIVNAAPATVKATDAATKIAAAAGGGMSHLTSAAANAAVKVHASIDARRKGESSGATSQDMGPQTSTGFERSAGAGSLQSSTAVGSASAQDTVPDGEVFIPNIEADLQAEQDKKRSGLAGKVANKVEKHAGKVQEKAGEMRDKVDSVVGGLKGKLDKLNPNKSCR